MALVSTLTLVSCKKEFNSFSSYPVEPFAIPNGYSTKLDSKSENKEEPKILASTKSLHIEQTKITRLKTDYSFTQEKKVDEITTKKINPNTTYKRLKETNKEKKEANPRLSNARIMTIIGGLGLGFGIATFKFFPTGLLIFLFGIVFLVGIISLIMYLADPKPKL